MATSTVPASEIQKGSWIDIDKDGTASVVNATRSTSDGGHVVVTLANGADIWLRLAERVTVVYP